MQKPIKQSSNTRSSVAPWTSEAVFVVTTSAALLVGASLIGGTSAVNIVDSFSAGGNPMLNAASHSADVVAVMDSANERWIRFQTLATLWSKESRSMSSITEASMLPSYQRIIGMGEVAIPLILQQLKSEGAEPNHWFWALSSITGENPVPADASGNLRRMAAAWLKWSEDKGYAG